MIVQPAVTSSRPASMPASVRLVSAISRNTTLASPRGPNQPMNRVVDQWTFLPRSASATGTMRMTERLRSA